MNAIILPFALPGEEGLESASRPGFIVTDRSRIADGEREEALLRQLEEAPTPDEQERILNAIDAYQRELEEHERERIEAEEREREARW